MWLLIYIVSIASTQISALLNAIEVTDLKKFPHHAFLKIQYNSGINYYCGGAVLSDCYVVTSTHCVDDIDSVQVVLQALSTQDPNALYINILDVSESVIRSSELGEFALVKLPRPLEFSETIKPISFIEENLEWGGHKIIIAGLGPNSNKNGSALTYNYFEVIHTEDCGAAHGEQFLGPAYKCFLGYSGEDFSYPCFGNAGEAVLIEDSEETWRMIGVVVKADSCITRIPGIFSNIQPTTLGNISVILNN